MGHRVDVMLMNQAVDRFYHQGSSKTREVLCEMFPSLAHSFHVCFYFLFFVFSVYFCTIYIFIIIIIKCETDFRCT